MSKKISAYMLDPVDGVVRKVSVHVNNALKEYKDIIGCRKIAQIKFDSCHVVIQDNDSLLRQVAGLWRKKSESGDQYYIGRAIIVGSDETGGFVSARLSIEQLVERVVAFRPTIFPTAAMIENHGGTYSRGAVVVKADLSRYRVALQQHDFKFALRPSKGGAQ